VRAPVYYGKQKITPQESYNIQNDKQRMLSVSLSIIASFSHSKQGRLLDLAYCFTKPPIMLSLLL